MTTMLSPHFALEEMVISQTASRLNIDNTPSPAVIANLTTLAAALERVRAVLGQPMSIDSGYRSPMLNKAVGGVPGSAHITGYAADFICPAFGSPLDICRKLATAGIPFDQMIQEGTWVHFSVDPQMRGEILTKAPGGGYEVGLPS